MGNLYSAVLKFVCLWKCCRFCNDMKDFWDSSDTGKMWRRRTGIPPPFDYRWANFI